MSVFDRLEKMASATVDRLNATAFTLTPYARAPNARAGPDPDRAVITGKGVFDYSPATAGVELGDRSIRAGNDLRSLVGGREPVLSVDRRYLPTAADEPRQGDVVTFPDKPDLPVFSVVNVRRDGQSRLEITLATTDGQT